MVHLPVEASPDAQPLVSIYLPTHNRPHLLKRALNSILSQTYFNIQIIVIADSCYCETHELLESFAGIDNRVEWYSVDFKSPAKTRNFAISRATGKFITGVDDDDYFANDHIAYLCNLFLSLKDCTFLYFDYIELQSNRRKRVKKDPILTIKKLNACNIPGNQIFTYTHKLQEIGGFDESMKGWEDYDLWLRFSLRFGCGQHSSNPSYFMDTTHDSQRITTSNLNQIGAFQFYHKHRKYMSHTVQMLHELEFAYFSGDSFKPKYLYSFLSPCKIYALKLFLKLFLKKFFSIEFQF